MNENKPFKQDRSEQKMVAAPWRGLGSSSLARMRFLMLVCALPLISSCILFMTPSALAATWPVSTSALSTSLLFHQSYSAGVDSYVHSGIDIPASAGMQISSPLAGTVRFTGTVPSGDSRTSGGTSQKTMNAVSIETHGGKVITLMPFETITVQEGDVVNEGARLGSLAASGDNSTRASHVHMGYKQGNSYFDPMLLFGPQPASTQEPVSRSAQLPSLIADAVSSAGASAGQSHAVNEGSSLAQEGSDALIAPQVENASAYLRVPEETVTFGTIETGAYMRKSPAETSVTPAFRIADAMKGLGSSCLMQLESFIEALSAVAQLTCVPLPVLIVVSAALVISGASLLFATCARLLVPRIKRALHARSSALSLRTG